MVLWEEEYFATSSLLRPFTKKIKINIFITISQTDVNITAFGQEILLFDR